MLSKIVKLVNNVIEFLMELDTATKGSDTSILINSQQSLMHLDQGAKANESNL